MKDQLQNFKTLLATFNGERVISEDEIKEVLVAITAILANNKKDLTELTTETQAKIDEALEYISNHRNEVSALSSDIIKTKNLNDKALLKLQALLEKAKTIKDGKDGRNGKDADEEVIIEKVLSKIPLPKDGKDGKDGLSVDRPSIVEEVLEKIPKTEVLGGEIVEKINDLPIKKPFLIDASHIDNLPDFKIISNSNKYFGQLLDIDYTGLTYSNGKYGFASAQDLAPYFHKTNDDTDDIVVGTTNKFATAAEKTKLGYITVTQAVDLDTIESDTATNNAKVTNATHTGEVTGATALTVDKTAITGKTLVTAAVGDHVLIADASDSDNLKRVTVQTIVDLAAGGITIGDTVTSATEGSVLFAGASGVLAQDNSTFYWNHATDRLGIGTNAKLSRFTVKQAATGAITGTSNTKNSTTVTGSGTLFLTEVGIGDRIEEAGFGYVLVTAIASDTSLTVTPALQGDSAANPLNTKKAISRWDDSSGATRVFFSDEGYVAIGSSLFRPLYPLHIADINGLAVSASATGRQYRFYADDPSGALLLNRSDVAGNLAILFGSANVDFSSTTATTLSFRLNLGTLNFISANGGGAGTITFGRRITDNNVACGAAVEFWPTNTQTTPAAAVMAPGGASYRLKFMPDGSIEFTNSGNMVFNTTTGTKIGTATTQKLAFYNSTPIVQPANTVALNDVLVNLGLRASGGVSNFTTNIDISTKDIVTDTTTGTKIGTGTTQKLGFFNATPVVRPTALTTQLTSITHTSPGTPDYAIQDLVDSSGGAAFGFATKDEGNTVLSVILNLQTRVAELETKLQALGLLA